MPPPQKGDWYWLFTELCGRNRASRWAASGTGERSAMRRGREGGGRQNEPCRETAGTLVSASQLVATHPLWGTLATPGDILGCHNWGGGALARSRQWPWMLNTIKCKGEPTPTLWKKNHPAQVSTVLRFRNPVPREGRGRRHRGASTHKHTVVRMPAEKGNSLTCSTNCCSNSIIRGVKFLRLLRSLKLFFQTKGEKRTAQKNEDRICG